MKACLILVLLLSVLFLSVPSAFSHNPFTAAPEDQHCAPAPPFKSKFFVKIMRWQHQLNQKISGLIRESRATGNYKPLLALLALAFTYGLIHAAGPGHGKFVASSYALSHNLSLASGLLFGGFFAFIHGLSGVVGVLGLSYLIKQTVSGTLDTVTTVTQVISFSLIVLLGLGILIKNSLALFKDSPTPDLPQTTRASRTGLLAWAGSIGLIPCPAVVMVMLFCLSMEALVLGLLLAACISLGMATTISIILTIIILGKAGSLKIIPTDRVRLAEHLVGLLSGAAIATFGLLFLLTAIS